MAEKTSDAHRRAAAAKMERRESAREGEREEQIQNEF